jgi:NifU-like protein involved in Fe-S cluster formation
MSSALYTIEVLRLAASTSEFPRLDAPAVTFEMRSAICGSKIKIDIRLDGDGHISEIGEDVTACALGQASATLLGRHAVGKSLDDVETAKNQLQEWLASETDTPGNWPGLSVFGPARRHSARHSAILLPFEATVQAIRNAAQ